MKYLTQYQDALEAVHSMLKLENEHFWSAHIRREINLFISTSKPKTHFKHIFGEGSIYDYNFGYSLEIFDSPEQKAQLNSIFKLCLLLCEFYAQNSNKNQSQQKIIQYLQSEIPIEQYPNFCFQLPPGSLFKGRISSERIIQASSEKQLSSTINHFFAKFLTNAQVKHSDSV